MSGNPVLLESFEYCGCGGQISQRTVQHGSGDHMGGLGYSIEYFQYNSKDQLVKTWGPGAKPTYFAYDAYGQKVEMRTYKNEPDLWNQALGDQTLWSYAAHGALMFKEDASGVKTHYDYYQDSGRLKRNSYCRKRW
ncbi:MAG: hypothetical protein LR015_01025 [Verrucomicrobia bacterium]|nr:hypothetical protein [Verrucomicrobiota bacterium]